MPFKKYAHPWVVLKHRIMKGEKPDVLKFLNSIEPSEKARAISRLERDFQTKLFLLLTPEEAADLLKALPDEQAAGLIDNVSTKEASLIVDQLPIDEQVDLLSGMAADEAHAILDKLPPKEAEETRQMMRYPSDIAGGMMSKEFLAYSEDKTVWQVVEDMQAHKEKYSDYSVQYAYVISADKKLIGVLRLRDLILSPREESVRKIMITDTLKVNVRTKLDELIQLFEKYTFVGLPVVDEHDVLVGIVRRHEVKEASGERDKNTYLKSSGIVGGEELRSMPIIQRSRRRLSWLTANILLNIMAASVIAFYQDTLASVIALAVFLPIISDMSGCSGFQAVTVSIRELTLGLVKPFELVQVLLKEMGIGIMNGIVLGILLGLVALLWKGNFYLGIVVGGALAVNTIIAVSVGGIIPLLLQWMGKDPALASGLILTTITDMCGFFLALAFATALLPYLI